MLARLVSPVTWLCDTPLDPFGVVADVFLVQVMGMVLLILGVWMNASLYHFLRLSADYNQHMPLVFIVTGIVVVVVSILACIGTAKGQSAILYIVSGRLLSSNPYRGWRFRLDSFTRNQLGIKHCHSPVV